MPQEGYIALWRKSLDSRIFQNEGLWKVWTWCLLKASHKKRWTSLKTGRGTIEIEIYPGQFIFGRHSAAKELKMNPSTVWKRIMKLKNFLNLKITSNRQYSTISIINWDAYQIAMIKSDRQVTGKNGQKNAVKPRQIDVLGSKLNHSVFVTSKVTGKNNVGSIENTDNMDKRLLISNTESNKQVTSKEQASNTDNNVYNVNNKIYIAVYEFWNGQNIVQHKKKTENMDRAIKKALKDYSQDEIQKAIQNYGMIYKSKKHFFSYKWCLIDFLNRGLIKFLDESEPLTNFLKDKNKTFLDTAIFD